ncbi:MAG: Eco57I restriction-modification methylase domain-containing protein, partial [Bacillota bacterium]|nr:Eco57I restriction-modification methylase domain-containing protein [Bacillota bacterium]
SKFKALTKTDLDKLNVIFKKLKETKKKGALKRAGMARNGTGHARAASGNGGNTPASQQQEAEQKKLEKELLERLSTISIRIPLLFYGGEFEIEEGRLAEIITGIDDASWNIFMPAHLTKQDFRELVQYYNQETVIGAGKAIREKAKAADCLPPTERTIAIAEIFSHFQNPSHETVLTPWHIVNIHMALTLGGYCFYNENFEENTDEYYHRLQTPRFVSINEITEKSLGNSDANILEINSKSGLYPLYVVYSLYRAKLKELGKEESECLPEMLRKVWNDAVSQVYVICQSNMSVQITKRTLCGYDTCFPNLKSEKKLVEVLRDSPKQFVRKVTKAKYWKEGAAGTMKFEAVVGNPPYQEETITKESTTNGQVPRKNIFHYFQICADEISSRYISLIYPGGRWIHRFGKGLAEFGKKQINDPILSKIDFYPNAEDIFKDVAIADGISIVFKDKLKTSSGFTYVYHTDKEITTVHMDNPGDELISLNPQNTAILDKIADYMKIHKYAYLAERILPRSLFGVESSFVEENPDKAKPFEDGMDVDYDSEVKLFTNDKAGKAGRAKWYIVNKNDIPTGKEYIDEWQVIVSSANAGGQKRDSQLGIADNHSAFGRARVALASFKTDEEAINFYKFCKTYLVKFMFLMTDEALTSLGKKVPDFGNYKSDNGVLDFSKDLNVQLYELFGLEDDEISYIEATIKDKAGNDAGDADEDESSEDDR